MSVLIRTARLTDIDWLLGQLENFSKFYGTKRSLFGDLEYSRKFLEVMITEHVFLIADSDEFGPVGLIAGTLEPHTYNPEILTLIESFWWVDEKHRGGKAGLMLLNAFTEWGKKNVDWIWMTLETDSPVKDATLTRRGFKEQERSFLLEV